jgi:hypothetical protein
MVVGVQGFEPWTPCSQSRCATRLRYTPTEPIFYTDMVLQGKSCNIQYMGASFLSKFSKQIKGAIALTFLLTSLLGTHWIGFAHGISHSGLSPQNTELSCVDQARTVGHSSAGCHLLDALTLAGFIASAPAGFTGQKPFSNFRPAAQKLAPAPIQVALYQSRAPPSFTL